MTTLSWLLWTLSAFAYSDLDGDGYTAADGDCDDADAAISPSGAESCDALDNDCDGVADEEGCDCEQLTYNGHSYLVCDARVSWEDARDACNAVGYDLVTIDDEDENDTLISESVDLLSGTTWIGINDLEEEGTFTWADGTAVGYTDWALLEPDDGLLWSDEDCGSLSLPLVGLSADWYDSDCDTAADYICEAACEGVVSYTDGDGDGFGGEETTGCELPEGNVYVGGDCDDADDGVNPDAPEIVDGVDNDCDGYDDSHDGDADGLSDGEETEAGTDPLDADTDDGGVSDGDEVERGSDPLDGTDDLDASSGESDTGSAGGEDTAGVGGEDTAGVGGEDTAGVGGEDTAGVGGDDSASPDTGTRESGEPDTGDGESVRDGSFFGGGGCACSTEAQPKSGAFFALSALFALILRRRS